MDGKGRNVMGCKILPKHKKISSASQNHIEQHVNGLSSSVLLLVCC